MQVIEEQLSDLKQLELGYMHIFKCYGYYTVDKCIPVKKKKNETLSMAGFFFNLSETSVQLSMNSKFLHFLPYAFQVIKYIITIEAQIFLSNNGTPI